MSDLSILIKSSEALKDIIKSGSKPRVAVLGSFNSGKSTLVNRLLGLEISPVGVIPTTSCLMYFDYGFSFKASFEGFNKKIVFLQPAHLQSFLTRENFPEGRLDIQIPSPLLKKCLLIDTPGIDSLNKESFELAEKAAKDADKIIYLFHQRGIEDLNQLFLYKLAAVWKNKNLSDISFWLNCNLGASDGTSLETTRTVLRKIFLSPVRLNTINTFAPENIETLRLFLELELAKENFRYAADNLKKIDVEIPERIKKVAKIKDEALFLSEFWRVYEMSRTVLEAGQVIYSIPVFSKELDKRFELMNSANLGEEKRTVGGMPYRPRIVGIKENRKALLDLIGFLLRESQIVNFIDRSKLEELYCQIERERFTVVAAGGFSTGKSTFINALLKEKILPTADGPTTASVTTVTRGSQKKATIYTPFQTTIRIYERVGDGAVLNSEVLAALEKWITARDSSISFLEACVDGSFEPASREKIADMIRKTKKLFAAGTFAGIDGNATVPEVFRRIPEKRLKGKKVLQKVRVTFRNPGAQEFNLALPAEVQSFWNAMQPDNALKIEKVEIQHPSEFLELAVLVDTPGLDWIQKHHCERTSRSIKEGDAYLIFLNGKHILNQMDRDNVQLFFYSHPSGFSSMDEASIKEDDRFYYIVNFADALTISQRETVYNFVRNSLVKPPRAGKPDRMKPKIFLISALKGLAGIDHGMGAFLKSLEEGILKYRGRDFYLAKANELYSILDSATGKINDCYLDGRHSVEVKKNLRRAQEILRESKRKLKDIRNIIFSSGRF